MDQGLVKFRVILDSEDEAGRPYSDFVLEGSYCGATYRVKGKRQYSDAAARAARVEELKPVVLSELGVIAEARGIK